VRKWWVFLIEYKYINSLLNNLIRQTDYLEKIINNISEILLIIDSEGYFKDIWTTKNEDLIVDAEMALDKHISEVLPEHLVEKLKTKILKTLRTGEIEVFDYNLLIEGKKKYFEAKLIKLTEEEDDILVIIRDITERVEREKRIEYLSFHDELTGLYNRRFINTEVKRLCNSRKLPISIIIGDLDKLKNVNDNYGHTQGDKYIKKASDILKCIFRNEDIIARIGGDEFAVLLPETDEEMAEKICDRIRDSFKKADNDDFPIPLSISLGCATMNSEDNDLIKYYKEADKQMYKNKGSK
jgi:diguanylate cyclase (GGDEF)-like protein/PAS domain S-box-containing protein